MQILSTGSGEHPVKSLVLQFGLGMIGSSIRDSLQKLGYIVQSDWAFDWNDRAGRTQSHSEIEVACKALTKAPEKLSIVWSAGDAAFHSTSDEVSPEEQVFTESIGYLDQLRERLQPEQFEFHFVSSAGGLFEGQRSISSLSKPGPMRPYGQLKLNQETLLLNTFEASELAFYRPSSVYGPMLQNSRKGLINNLVNNGRNARVTVLDAHVMSLRDYVFSHDIGYYVARSIKSGSLGNSKSPERFLVSARSSSIFEVVRKIQRILNLNLRVRYDENFGNNRNITFSERVLPTDWHPVSLDVGLRQFLVNPSRSA